jgi:hypothetical protein
MTSLVAAKWYLSQLIILISCPDLHLALNLYAFIAVMASYLTLNEL